MKPLTLGVLAALACGVTACVNPDTQPGAAPGATPTLEQRASHDAPMQYQTTLRPLQQSLEGLLNQGWAIIAASEGSFVLRRMDKWALCGLSSPDPTKMPDRSECYTLN